MGRQAQRGGDRWCSIWAQITFVGREQIHLVNHYSGDTGVRADHICLPKWAVQLLGGDTGDMSTAKWDRKLIKVRVLLSELSRAARRR